MVLVWIVGSVLGFVATVSVLGGPAIAAVGVPAFLAEFRRNLGRIDAPGVTLVLVALWLTSLWGSRTWKWIAVPVLAGGVMAFWGVAVATIGV